MATNKTATSPGKKAQLANYKASGQYSKNRRARLERHLRHHPGDEQAKQALEDGKNGFEYRRQPPKSRIKTWSPENKRLAHMFRISGLNGNNVFLADKRKRESYKA